MKNAALKKYLEENPGSEELINTISLLEDFTGWEFSVRSIQTKDKPALFIVGIEHHPTPESGMDAISPPTHDLYTVLKSTPYPYTTPYSMVYSAVEYFKGPLEPSKTVLDKLHQWCRDSLFTLNETETSIRMKLELKGLGKPEEIT